MVDEPKTGARWDWDQHVQVDDEIDEGKEEGDDGAYAEGLLLFYRAYVSYQHQRARKQRDSGSEIVSVRQKRQLFAQSADLEKTPVCEQRLHRVKPLSSRNEQT